MSQSESRSRHSPHNSDSSPDSSTPSTIVRLINDEQKQQRPTELKLATVIANRAQHTISRLGYRPVDDDEEEDDEPMNDMLIQQVNSDESYDNLDNSNSIDAIDASFATEGEEEETLDKSPDTPTNDNADFLSVSNTASFIFSNGRFHNNKAPLQSSSLSGTEFASNNEAQQISEEINDDEDDAELRNYDDEYNAASYGDDEFFLISSPSPIGLTRPTPRAPQIEPGDAVFRYAYELNRLSNIIEEEDEEEARAHRLSTAFTERQRDLQEEEEEEVEEEADEPEDEEEEEDEEGENSLKGSIENFREMLMLGEQVTHSYKKIEAELSKPSVEYKPVMKKRVYHLNGVYENPAPVYSLKRDADTARLTRTFTQTTNYPGQNGQESGDYSMLNYLIGRLSDQHKTKLSNNEAPSIDSPTKAKINSDFDEFEKQLFEKYGLPVGQSEEKEESNDELIKVIHLLFINFRVLF